MAAFEFLDDRENTVEFFVCTDGVGAGAGRFAADFDDVCSFSEETFGLGDGVIDG
jgi:hypothetical protein